MTEIDFSKMDQVSASLFTRQRGPSVTIKNDGIIFNSDCLDEFKNIIFIQIIIDKIRKIIYIVGCQESDVNALKWCNNNGDRRRPRKLSGKGFADLLFVLMNWDVRNRYIVRGEKILINERDVIKFSLDEAENITDMRINRIVKLLKNVSGVVIPDK